MVRSLINVSPVFKTRRRAMAAALEPKMPELLEVWETDGPVAPLPWADWRAAWLTRVAHVDAEAARQQRPVSAAVNNSSSRLCRASQAPNITTRRGRGTTLQARRLRPHPEVACSILCARVKPASGGARVDEDAFNLSVRKFLKQLGVTAQREIELSVREQLEAGELHGDETLDAQAAVIVSGLPRDVVVTGTIALT